MIYAPHILQRKSITVESDEYGQPIAPNEGSWEVVCGCRCDDVTTDWRNSENGEIYQTHHHVVCNGRLTVKEGDYVRCVEGETIKSEGEVYKVKVCNFFNYTEIYL